MGLEGETEDKGNVNMTKMGKYGVLSKEEAEEDAKTIEESAFAAADQHYQKEPDGDGSSAVQVYAKESSKLMLEVLKRGPRMKEDGEAAAAEKSAAVHADLFDISGGRRAFISAEEAEDLLKPLKEPETHILRSVSAIEVLDWMLLVLQSQSCRQ
ncbi:hypothetical protein GH714_024987 [Hevea brasiliensis]|uniref:WPP domain-containing protein n=1 Tax=Hevea brasiliensis TaxID=3981 RepID=A0A6A6NJ81_HEVBR|nr:hypothetical protein GH714_024987 [Hevea brasiliensis]